VLVGGDGPTVLDRVLRFGDGWMPEYTPETPILERAAELEDRAQRPIEVTVAGVPADPGAMAPFEQAGVRRVLHWLPSAHRSVVEAALDRYEAAIATLHGE
jgi:hypothetical protein